MGLNGLGRCLVAGTLCLVGSLYSLPETKAGVVMTSVTDRNVYTPGDLVNVKVGLDNTNHPGEVFSAEYVLQVPSFFGNVSKGPPSTNGFFPNPKFFEVIDWPGRLSGVVDSGVGVSNTNGFIGEYTFSTIGATLGEYTLGLTHTNVYDHNVDLQPIDVQNGEIVITYPGDANLNYQVTIGDVTILAENFGKTGGWQQGDFTRDGLVSIGDLTILAENFGAGNYSSLSSSVPTPSTFVAGLTLLGLAGLSGRGRGKKQGLIGRIYQSGLRDSGLGVGIIGANH